MSAEIRAFQIFYDEKTRASLDRDFEPLDNAKSERPDWYEYWPIRSYLSQHELDESTFYGFLSPRFADKTLLSGAAVKDFVRRCEDADVVTFSPFPCHGAAFINVFEQGEFFHRGLSQAAVRFFEEVDPDVKLETLVMDSRDTVFSNFFLAKREFWSLWKAVLDQMFEMCETPGAPLHSMLTGKTEYMKDTGEMTLAHMKIFVMERAASFLLATRAFRVRNYLPFAMPVCEAFKAHLPDVVRLDALKIAFSETGIPHYREVYLRMRDEVIGDTWGAGSRLKAV